MNKVGYASLVETLGLQVLPPVQPAFVDGSVNRRVDTDDRILFPTGVALTDSPLGHLEFALRHEGINLAILASALPVIGPGPIIERIRESPNGEYIRRAAFLWEWLTGDALNAGANTAGTYIDLFDPEEYMVAANPVRAPTYRVNNNALGTPQFCPTVRRAASPGSDWLGGMMARAGQLAASSQQTGLYDRAIQYLYLSETKSSFAIEHEVPNANKEERFVQILRRAGETSVVSEDYLVAIQNAVVRDDFSKEASYRTRQNWLEDRLGRISFLPHPVEGLRETMAGWEAFVNDTERGVDPLVKTACGAFGFVYLHPFMDGNGRLHRFMIHHLLAQTGQVPEGMIIPVSAVIMKHIQEYLDVLNGFSKPATQLWNYLRGDEGPIIHQAPGVAPYRFVDASHELMFLAKMIGEAVEEEIPKELAYLSGYDRAYERIQAAFDLPSKDIGKLIRMIQGNNGRLANGKRNQFERLPDDSIHRIEGMVQASFAEAEEGSDRTV